MALAIFMETFGMICLEILTTMPARRDHNLRTIGVTSEDITALDKKVTLDLVFPQVLKPMT